MHVANTSRAFDELSSMVESDVTILSQHPIMTTSTVTSPWPMYDEMSDSNICEEFSNSSSLEETNEGLFQNLKLATTVSVENNSRWSESNTQFNDIKTMESLNGGAENGQSNVNICYGCQNKIEEQYLLNISGLMWHESCAKCYICDVTLTSSCFLGGRRLYCKKDYDAIRKTCNGCKLYIHDDQLVVRIASSPFIYHVTCFYCSVCKLLLQKGDEFVFNQNKDIQEVKCKKCVWESVKDTSTSEKPHQQEIMNKKMLSPNLNCEIGETLLSPKSNSYLLSPKSNDNDVEDEALSSDDEFYNDSGSKDGSGRKGSRDDRLSKDSKKSKRPRTILNAVQRRAFKIAFELTPKPCRKVREKLAHDTGLTVRVVQVWFQNQRAKVKKIAKRHHTQEVAAQKAREELGLHMFDPMMPIHYLPGNTLHGCDMSMDVSYVHMHHQKHFPNIQQGEMLWEYQREEMQHSDQQNYHNHTTLYRPHTSIYPNDAVPVSGKDNVGQFANKILPHHQDAIIHPNMDVSSHSGNDMTGAINGLCSMQNQYFSTL